ncbi:MAG: helix-turn-helix domain-containing protein [Erythrobacter sp.]|jgi:transcriptional regulator GlxA family with amidase domain|nr:helix-turn-helix domain-containing protein [Erythrobacter sp.]
MLHHSPSPRKIVIVAFEGANPLDVAGPSSTFDTANRLIPNSYEIIHASFSGGECVTESGLRFSSLVPLSEIGDSIDTLMIAGGSEEALVAAASDARFLAEISRAASLSRRAGAVCTGAFLLGAAGLLKHRKAVTHWASCDRLQAMFPGVSVLPDAVFVRDGAIFTSAGMSASIDLTLGLIEEDLGHRIAAKVARNLVVFLRRPGGQAQFSEALAAQERAGGAYSDLVSWILENPEADLSVMALAQKVGASERTFQRHFRKEVGKTPSQFVRAIRVEAARRWLEETDWPLKRVAQRAGFGSVDSLERAFFRSYRRSPGAVRAAFSSNSLSGTAHRG